MKPHRIILIRHGECHANTDESKFATEPDYTIELTEKGVAQAREAGQKLRELVDEESRNQRIRVGFAVTSDTVFSWVQDYYVLDDKEQMEQKEKEAEENFLEKLSTSIEGKKPAGKQKGKGQTKKAKTEEKKKPDNTSDRTENKSEEEQISLFDVGMTE